MSVGEMLGWAMARYRENKTWPECLAHGPGAGFHGILTGTCCDNLYHLGCLGMAEDEATRRTSYDQSTTRITKWYCADCAENGRFNPFNDISDDEQIELKLVVESAGRNGFRDFTS